MIILNRSVAQILANRPNDAVPTLRQIVERYPEKVEAAYWLGRAYEAMYEDIFAINWYLLTLALDETNEGALLGIGRCLMGRFVWDGASCQFEEVLSRNPECEEAILGLAKCRENLLLALQTPSQTALSAPESSTGDNPTPPASTPPHAAG